MIKGNSKKNSAKMPVVSPSQYNTTSSSLSGSYRTTLTSSTVEKPYFRSTTGNYDTLRSYERSESEYRSRFCDIDGNRDRKTILERQRSSLAPGIADSDSGVSSRYRSDRSESRSRDISTTKYESSKTSTDLLPGTRRPVLTSADLAMSHAEWYNKYSPANYIPLTQRIQQQQNQNSGEISRSKSISNYIGRSPVTDPTRLAKNAGKTGATIAEISQPVSSGTTPKKQIEINHTISEISPKNDIKTEPRKARANLKYIDSEDEKILLENNIESPRETGFENKTFEHENNLKKRTAKSEDVTNNFEDVKSMETSTESTISEPTEDLAPETKSARRRVLDTKDLEDTKRVADLQFEGCARSSHQDFTSDEPHQFPVSKFQCLEPAPPPEPVPMECAPPALAFLLPKCPDITKGKEDSSSPVSSHKSPISVLYENYSGLAFSCTFGDGSPLTEAQAPPQLSNSMRYKVVCQIKDKKFEGYGSSKKLAKLAAAWSALAALEEERADRADSVPPAPSHAALEEERADRADRVPPAPSHATLCQTLTDHIGKIQQQQNQNSGEISRSKSLSNDIGRPPAADPSSLARQARNTAATISERTSRPVLTSADIAMYHAEWYNKYSPANYLPLAQRIQQQQNQKYGEITRSKSISNDIGRPPAVDPSRLARKERNTPARISEVPKISVLFENQSPERRSYKENSPPVYKKSMLNGVKDTNGYELPSVSEIRKSFDQKMTVTKLHANDSRYTEKYLNQLKDCENGTVGYTKIVPEDEKPVPVLLAYEKNGLQCLVGPSSSRSNSNSDLPLSKTISEPVCQAKPIHDRNSSMSTSLTSKLPSNHLASIKKQLDPDNSTGKILEKSTVIHVENGDLDYKKHNAEGNKIKDIKSDIEKQTKALKHTSNFTSYKQISQPVSSGTAPKKQIEINLTISEISPKNDIKTEPRKARANLKYIDSEDEKILLESNVDSPSRTGIENKTLEYEKNLKKRTKKSEDGINNLENVMSMETSTESTISEPTEDLAPETKSARRRVLDTKDLEDIKRVADLQFEGCARSSHQDFSSDEPHQFPDSSSPVSSLFGAASTASHKSPISVLYENYSGLAFSCTFGDGSPLTETQAPPQLSNSMRYKVVCQIKDKKFEGYGSDKKLAKLAAAWSALAALEEERADRADSVPPAPSHAALEEERADRADRVPPAPSHATLRQTIADHIGKIQQQQNQNSGEISRSKSISNDIGRPPAADSLRLARHARNTAATISEEPKISVIFENQSPERRSYEENSPVYKKNMLNGVKGTNGHEVPSVSEIRKQFDQKMTVTKLPANDSRYTEQCLNKLKGHTKIATKDEKPVPVLLPYEKNGLRWVAGSSSSRSNSNSDLSLSKTISELVCLAKPIHDRNSSMSPSLNSKLPSNHLASIKKQLDPDNPIGKILEKSTVIHVENCDLDYKKHNAEGNKIKDIKSDIEKQTKALKHTSNFTSYIHISQPVSSGTTPKKQIEINHTISEISPKNDIKTEPRKARANLKYIDSEDEKILLENNTESPSGTGIETFEHEKNLKKRTEKSEDGTNHLEDVKSMETSTESTISEPTEDLAPETPSDGRRVLDTKDLEDIKRVADFEGLLPATSSHQDFTSDEPHRFPVSEFQCLEPAPPPEPVPMDCAPPALPLLLPECPDVTGVTNDSSSPVSSLFGVASHKSPISVLYENYSGLAFSCTFGDGSPPTEAQAPPQLSNSMRYKVVCQIKDKKFEGYGSNKKQAKLAAAWSALAALEEERADRADRVPPAPSHAALDEERVDRADRVPSAPSHGTLRQTLADHIGKLVNEKFNELMKNDLVHSKRMVLAGIVITTHNRIEDARVIAVTTGTKCVSGEHMSVSGRAVNDCHAEVVARRCLQRHLYAQLFQYANQPDPSQPLEENDLEPLPGGGYQLKASRAVHLYISTAPCGDGRIFSPHEDHRAETDKHPHRLTRGQLRTKIESGEGTIPVKNCSNVMQTWDGVMQGERLLTMSCSDKVARWCVCGLQGALLSSLIRPVYLTSLVLGSMLHPHHMYRAICGRIEAYISSLPPHFHQKRPLLSRAASTETRSPARAPSSSVCWCSTQQLPEVIKASTGKLESGQASQLCKQSMFARWRYLVRRLPLLPQDAEDGAPLPEMPHSMDALLYNEAKQMCPTYQLAKQRLIEAFEKAQLGHWIKRPLEQDQFVCEITDASASLLFA